MDPELEGLIRAYDATKQAAPEEVARLRAIYDLKLDQVTERCPKVSRHTLEGLVRLAHRRWLSSQETPTTLPPRA